MSGFCFNEENSKKFEKLKKRYPDIKSLTLPGLWLIQEQEGWISLEAMKYLAKKLDLSEADIYSVATFYTMFKLEPKGKYHICLCKTASCKLRGSQKILQKIEKKLGIKPGETTPDGKFSLEEVECLGACGNAPAMSLNDIYHENLTVDKIENILDGLE
jgi:NADH-quinone oxidoreductase subunit E